MKIVLQWQPDSKTHVSIEGKSAEKVIAAAGKLMRFTTPSVISTVTADNIKSRSRHSTKPK